MIQAKVIELKDLNELRTLIEKWALDRGILPGGSAVTQVLKLVSEVGELADAQIKGSKDEVIDAIGDCFVVLCSVAKLNGYTLDYCVSKAWAEIKDRKGKTLPNGNFVKDEQC